jgi:hypothetical protein
MQGKQYSQLLLGILRCVQDYILYPFLIFSTLAKEEHKTSCVDPYSVFMRTLSVPCYYLTVPTWATGGKRQRRRLPCYRQNWKNECPPVSLNCLQQERTHHLLKSASPEDRALFPKAFSSCCGLCDQG